MQYENITPISIEEIDTYSYRAWCLTQMFQHYIEQDTAVLNKPVMQEVMSDILENLDRIGAEINRNDRKALD